MSRSSVIRTVNELVELGLLQKQYRIDEFNQKTNCYRVSIWQQCKALPVQDPAIHGRYLTGTGGSVTQTLGGYQRDTGVVSEVHPKKNNITKTINYKTKGFDTFWKTYRSISPTMRVVSQSKKLAKEQYAKLGRKTQEKLTRCLEADIKARTKQLKNDSFAPLFPDCFRWIKNGQYEQYLELPTQPKPTTFRKLKNTPF